MARKNHHSEQTMRLVGEVEEQINFLAMICGYLFQSLSLVMFAIFLKFMNAVRLPRKLIFNVPQSLLVKQESHSHYPIYLVINSIPLTCW